MEKKTEAYLFNMCMVHDLENDKVLVQNKVNTDWKGHTFPDGKIEHGESFIESTIREVKEETGLVVRNLKPSGVINWYNTENHERWLVFLYVTNEFSGDLINETHEGKVFWMSFEDLEKSMLAPNMEKYLMLFRNENINEAYATWNSNEQSEFKLL